MVGWHHPLNGHEFEQASGVGDGQGSLACCSPWGHKESDMTERLNRTNSDTQKRQRKELKHVSRKKEKNFLMRKEQPKQQTTVRKQ